MITGDIITLRKPTQESRELEILSKHHTSKFFGLIQTHTVVGDRKTNPPHRRYVHLIDVKFLGKVVITIVFFSHDKGAYVINGEAI